MARRHKSLLFNGLRRAAPRCVEGVICLTLHCVSGKLLSMAQVPQGFRCVRGGCRTLRCQATDTGLQRWTANDLRCACRGVPLRDGAIVFSIFRTDPAFLFRLVLC